MKKNLKIGWQKYEDFVEKQLSSPLLGVIMEHIASKYSMFNKDDDDNETDFSSDNHSDDDDEHGVLNTGMPFMMPISPQLIDDLAMLSSFDCWIGHTNFDITPRIQEKLDCVDGVELLKVCSRYRFFIGVGHMFDFKDVRKNIENELITK